MIDVDTTQLQVGDVVLTHGMRVRLDREPGVCERRDRTVYVFDGRVENPEEVRAEGVVPIAWLYPEEWHGGWVRNFDAEPRWTIQGNDLATWTVER